MSVVSDIWLVRKAPGTQEALVAMPFRIPAWYTVAQREKAKSDTLPAILNVFCPDKLQGLLWRNVAEDDAVSRQQLERWMDVYLESCQLNGIVVPGDVLLPVLALVPTESAGRAFYWGVAENYPLTVWVVTQEFRDLWLKNGFTGALFYPMAVCDGPADVLTCCEERRRQIIGELIFSKSLMCKAGEYWLMVVTDMRPCPDESSPSLCGHCGAHLENKSRCIPDNDVRNHYVGKNMMPPWFVSFCDIFTCRWYPNTVFCSDEVRQLLQKKGFQLSFSPAGWGILSFHLDR
ncbi:MAG: hypothetical protein KatS3mg110_3325 [Pirellulaceae bacterium]|nr:MAG: hypothetical protein KatS3mg110_3325 [Pirellulaceae bacterium]